MKVFIADTLEIGFYRKDNYHWCDNGELLMFGQFQSDNGNPSEVSMCGTKTRKFTTHIVVKDLNITEDFYKEIINKSVENAMNCKIDKFGNYITKIGFDMEFNINEIVNELLIKASKFEDGQKVYCRGRNLYIVN